MPRAQPLLGVDQQPGEGLVAGVLGRERPEDVGAGLAAEHVDPRVAAW
jgi:hypothetical protein